MKIGIIGGTFDPVHYGHLLLAERFREELDLDKIIFIPTGTSYHKDTEEVSPSELRYRMLEMAISDNEKFAISDIEVKRNGNSYTCDTVRELKKRFQEDEFFFLIGTDILFTIEEWKEVDWLFQNIRFLLALREGFERENINEKLAYLTEERGADIMLREFDLVNISSTKIRENVKRNKSIKYLLPVQIENFIKENGIYQEERVSAL